MTLKDIINGMRFVIKSRKKPKTVSMQVTGDYKSPKVMADRTPLREISEKKGLYTGVAVSHPVSDDELELIKQNFNSITAENLHKWPKLLKDPKGNPLDYDFSKADKLTDWANDNGLRVRGHTLVWSKMNHTHPKAINHMIKESSDPEKMMKDLLEKHIHTVMGHYKGKIQQWDVVNEVFRYGEPGIDGIFHEVLGKYYVDDVFRMAHEADPGAELVFNETIGTYNKDKAIDLLDYVKGMLDRGVPIHGIGVQDHNNARDIDEFIWFIEEVERMGLFLEITEMDMRANFFRNNPDKYDSQAEIYYQRVKAAVDNKCCRGITFWGLDDSKTWMDQIPGTKSHAPNEPLLFDKDKRKKPAYYGVRRALEETISR